MGRAGADDNVRAIILTGAGRGFCAGADMGHLENVGAGLEDPDQPITEDPVPHSACPDFRTRHSYFPAIPKPVIAAINGPCAGLGLVLALYCDLRFAADEAMFTTSFARRGLIAEHGIAWLMPALVGPSVALDLLMSARRFSADEALRMGLVNRIVPGKDLLTVTREYARMLTDECSPLAVSVIKRQVWQAQFQTLAEAIALADVEMERSFVSEDFREGIAHFVEKRRPAFTGR
jgi:enoyl-CoA hydratase/carnithine racemase